jgi:hypothetical protein
MRKFLLLSLTFLVTLCSSQLSVANAATIEKTFTKKAVTVDVAVNIVGIESAAKELSGAMKNVAQSINKALQSDKLSSQERTELLQVLSSFKDIKGKFAGSLHDAKEPIRAIVADANSQVSNTVSALNQSILEPFTFKFQLVFYIFMALVVLVILGIIVFIKVYVLGAINRASTSASNLVSTIDKLPATVETILIKVESQKNSQRQPRFKRNIKAHKK